jgi:hypothetical protein
MLLVVVNWWLVSSGALQESVKLAATVRLRQRRSWRSLLPWAMRAAGVGPGRPMVGLADHHDGVQGSMQLAVPARLSRWRTTWPEKASTGAAPPSIAKAASERNRPGCDN